MIEKSGTLSAISFHVLYIISLQIIYNKNHFTYLTFFHRTSPDFFSSYVYTIQSQPQFYLNRINFIHVNFLYRQSDITKTTSQNQLFFERSFHYDDISFYINHITTTSSYFCVLGIATIAFIIRPRWMPHGNSKTSFFPVWRCKDSVIWFAWNTGCPLLHRSRIGSARKELFIPSYCVLHEPLHPVPKIPDNSQPIKPI